MLETFLATLNPMLMMFTCILIGFVLKKTGVAPENTGTVLSKVENYVLMPAQVGSAFLTYCTVESILAHSRLVLYSILCITLSVLLSGPLSKLFSKDGKNRGIYRYALVFSNFGFLGNALIPQMLGEEYLYPYLLFMLPANAWVFIWGINQMAPPEGEKVHPLKQLLNPVLIGIAVGATLGLTGISKLIPTFLMTTINSLSGCMGPVAMILTGFIIGGYDLKELLQDRKIYGITALRLTVLPALMVAVTYLLGADRLVMIMALVGYGAALGLNTVVIPAAYGRDTKPGASMAMISHALAVISLPLMYALLCQIVKG